MKEPQPSVLHRDLFSVENAGRLTSESLKESLLRRAYFTELKEVLAEKESLEQHLSRLDSQHQFMLKGLRNNERMVDRLANRWGRLVMRQTLADWKKIIIRKKYTRVLLEKTRWRWAKQRLMLLFRRWNDYAVGEKVRKFTEQIQLYRDSKHDFHELNTRLQVQIEGARNMLDAVAVEDYVDASVLLLKGEDDSELLRLPSELLVLRWINFQLEQSSARAIGEETAPTS
eukprot:jgi/Phyca11/16513/fgenesh1_pg.PHYCAscaffold_20_\